jgi:hypothetical protein
MFKEGGARSLLARISNNREAFSATACVVDPLDPEVQASAIASSICFLSRGFLASLVGLFSLKVY